MKQAILLILPVICLACSSTPQSPGPAPTTMPQSPAENGEEIVRVVSRDSVIIARTGADGPVYSVQGNDGREIVPGMTLGELQSRNPGLAAHIRSMNAAAVGWGGVE